MSNWNQHIITAFEKETHTTELPIKTVFNGLYLPNYNLLFHFISIDENKFKIIEQNYFATISDDATLQNIKCIHVWEDVFHNNKELVISRLLALIGNRKRIHARATIVKRIDKNLADSFLNTNHLQQSVSAYYKFGLYYKEELVAVATFSKSRVMNDGIVPYRSYELIRFASIKGATVTGGLSKLLNAFIKEVNPVHIMTYADRDWGTGEGYETLGFTASETIGPVPFYLNAETIQRYTANQLNAQAIIPKTILKVNNSGSYKYILDRRK